MITSPHNEKLKLVRRLSQSRRERTRAGSFVAEGEDLLEAADAAGWRPVERLCAAGSGLAGTEVDAAALASVAGLASGTRTLAIYEARWEAAPVGRLCVYVHGVRDPGNLGTILRSAQAFGAASVAIGPGSADPFGPRAVRASMGAIFAVPLARANAAADPRALPGTTIALDAAAPQTLAELGAELDTGGELTILVGAERQGLPPELIAGVDHAARIPIASESLNVAMAATVALYELTRRIRPA